MTNQELIKKIAGINYKNRSSFVNMFYYKKFINEQSDLFGREEKILYNKKIEAINLMSLSVENKIEEVKKLDKRGNFNPSQFKKECGTG